MELTDFLLARIAEDESVARHAPFWSDVSSGLRPRGVHNAAFAERVTPERVLAECEVKRQILRLHEEGGWCDVCHDADDRDGPHSMSWPCPTVRALALLYADHPDYRQEWRP